MIPRGLFALVILFIRHGDSKRSDTTTMVAPAENTDDLCVNTPTIVTQAVASLDSINSSISGLIQFDQPNGEGIVAVTGAISGLSPGNHGLHIHEFGNVADNCMLAGDHYNPDNFTHGNSYDAIRHAGDLGNVYANADGVATVDIKSRAFTLNGKFNVVGRSVVLHQDEDDLGLGGDDVSLSNGHSGTRIACGIIAISVEEANPKYDPDV